MKMIEKIMENGQIYAVVLRKDFSEPGTNFFTPGEFSQQLGILIHEKGKIINRHRHKLVKREILRTQEVLVLLEGKLKIDLYDDQSRKLKTLILQAGDAILLARGGHHIEFLENSKIIEIKQGPYAGFDDKDFF